MAKVHFATDFQPSFGIPWRPVLTRAQVEGWDNERLAHYLSVRKGAEKGALDNPVGQGWSLPMWELVQKNWGKYQNHVILGGNRCLRGDSMIYDPVLKTERRIDSISGSHHVLAWDGHKLVVAEAERPFAKPAGPMHRVRLSNGKEFVGASEHRILLSDGSWKQLSHLRVGEPVFLPRTTSDISHQDRGPGVPRWNQTQSDSQGDYLTSRRLCDAQPHSGEDSGQDAFPLLGGAPKRISVCDSNRHSPSSFSPHSHEYRLDGLGNEYGRSQAVWSFSRHSNSGVPQRLADLSVGTSSHASYRPCIEVLPNNGNQAFRLVGQQPTVGSFHQPQSSDESVLWGNLSCYESTYVESIDWAGTEVKWDMTVPAYANYWHAGIIHHNSSKSVFASRLSLWAAGTIPEAEVRCFHVNEDRSIQDQQAMIYEALPVGIKNLPTKKGMHHSLQYSQKNGFTDNICILPPLPGYRKGGSLKFGNYRQYQQDAQIIEGFKAHLAWCDEECPLKMFETLQYRMVDYHGRIILTFTTLNGWTPLVQDILGKTKTIEKRFAPLVGRELPIMQESLSRPGTAIYYFWTEDNAFIDSSDFTEKIKGRPKDEILARAYGIPTKSVSSVFPGFNKEINVIPHDKLPWLEGNLKKDARGNTVPYKVTRYMAIDPAGSKNWFMAWVAIDAAGTWWVYREYPDYDDWALPGNTAEGKPGPAQKGEKRGIKGYVELIKDMEGEEEIYERFIDPRMGAAERQSEEGATTIISDLDDAGMVVIPAPGVDIENGLQLLKNLMSYDEDKPIDSMNGPKIYVSDRCQNIIYALSEYTGAGGRNEATKDCVDVLRYLAVSNVDFIDPSSAPTELTHGRTGSY